MKMYTLPQWILFFFVYCFIGWVWECCYVSVRKRKWVNRGFIHGPFLPIYGSGALVILIVTIPVRNSIPLIFLTGMIGATILEYCTGACMERMFHVRYWDYSNNPLNLNGHICLFVSLGWGLGSVLLVRFAQLPIEHLVLMIPAVVSEYLALGLVVGFTIDFTQSFNEAMDLKATLAKLSASNEQIRILEKRIEVMVAFSEDSFRRYRMQKEENKKLPYKVRFMDNVRKMNEIKNEKMRELEVQVRQYFETNEKNAQDEKKYMALFENAKKTMMKVGSEKEYRRLGRILRRNPDAISVTYKDALREIKEMLENRSNTKNEEQEEKTK